MKKFFLCVLLIALFSCPALAGTSDRPQYVEGEVLVVIAAPIWADYDPDDDAFSQEISRQAEVFAGKYGLEAVTTYPALAKFSAKSIVHLRSESRTTADLITELSVDPDVESVEANIYFYANPEQTEGGSGCNTGYGSIVLLLSSSVFLVFCRKKL